MARRKKISGPACEWTLDVHEAGDSWDTACGEKWQFNDGGPQENHVRFCHGCGRRVIVTKASS